MHYFVGVLPSSRLRLCLNWHIAVNEAILMLVVIAKDVKHRSEIVYVHFILCTVNKVYTEPSTRNHHDSHVKFLVFIL